MAFDERQDKHPTTSWRTYRRPIKSLTVPRSLTDCCYSMCNMALLIAAIIALFYLIKFLSDGKLYEYGEHLLSLRFYRQLIYVIVIVPLVILVPLFNAFSAFMVTKQLRTEFGESLTKVKIIFQICVAFLVAIALFFIAPNMRHNPLASQIELEIRKHMRRFYESEFSYNFLDLLQNEYRCCDALWYRSNFNHDLPMSCLESNDGQYNVPRAQTCSEVIAALVSSRCMMVAACLIIILIALVCLISIDFLECTALTGREYKVQESRPKNEQQYALAGQVRSPTQQCAPATPAKPNLPITATASSESATDDDDEEIDVEDVEDGNFRRCQSTKSGVQRQVGAPLLQKSTSVQTSHHIDDQYESDEGGFIERGRYRAMDPYNSQCSPAVAARLANSAVLARANLVQTSRAQSPVFLVDESAQRPAPVGRGRLPVSETDQQRSRHLHSALKKHSSSSSTTKDQQHQSTKELWDVDAANATDEDDDEDDDACYRSTTISKNSDDSERFKAHQRDLQRDLQTRRSLLSVRFAE